MSVKVKPLEWVQAYDWKGEPLDGWAAASAVGAYRYGEYQGCVIYAERSGLSLPGSPRTLDDARALCEADYEQRVMSCLEVTP